MSLEPCSEALYDFYRRVQNDARKLADYSCDVDSDRKRELVENHWPEGIGIWCEDQYVGEISPNDCDLSTPRGRLIVHNLFMTAAARADRFTRTYRERKKAGQRRRGSLQETFMFLNER